MSMNKIVELFSQVSANKIVHLKGNGTVREIIRVTVDDKAINFGLAIAYKNIDNILLFFELYKAGSRINLYSYGEKDIQFNYARYRKAFNVKHIRFKLWSI